MQEFVSKAGSAGGSPNAEEAAEVVARRALEAMPPATWPFWFDGWPDEVEAALLDAAFSARATYGTAATGVRKVVTAWREHRGERLDDLTAFAAVSPADLITVLGNRQRVAGDYSTKAEAVRSAAAALGSVGVRCAADVDGSDAQRDAFTSIPGLGALSWDCFLNVLGIDHPARDAVVTEFVEASVSVDPAVLHDVVDLAAAALDVSSRTLRHSIWRYQRKLKQRPRAARAEAA